MIVTAAEILRNIADTEPEDTDPDPFEVLDDDAVIGVPVLATLCNRRRETVLRWAGTGRIPYVQKGVSGGRPYLFRVGDVREALKRMRRAS